MAGSAMLAVGVIVAGWLLSGGIRHFKDSERVVTVKGLAEREVKADRVIWPLSYKEVGNDMLALYNAMESANAKIVGFLKSNGIAESEISVAPAEIVDMQAERYVPEVDRIARKRVGDGNRVAVQSGRLHLRPAVGTVNIAAAQHHRRTRHGQQRAIFSFHHHCSLVKCFT